MKRALVLLVAIYGLRAGATNFKPNCHNKPSGNGSAWGAGENSAGGGTGGGSSFGSGSSGEYTPPTVTPPSTGGFDNVVGAPPVSNDSIVGKVGTLKHRHTRHSHLPRNFSAYLRKNLKGKTLRSPSATAFNDNFRSGIELTSMGYTTYGQGQSAR